MIAQAPGTTARGVPQSPRIARAKMRATPDAPGAHVSLGAAGRVLKANREIASLSQSQ